MQTMWRQNKCSLSHLWSLFICSTCAYLHSTSEQRLEVGLAWEWNYIGKILGRYKYPIWNNAHFFSEVQMYWTNYL